MPRILIVDDLKENIDLVSDTLSMYQADLEILRAPGGIKALEIIEELGPNLDLIILDASMPDLDGFAVCQQVKDDPETQCISILMLSGIHIASMDRSRGLTCGADSYLCKPYHPQELVAQVTLLLKLKLANAPVEAPPPPPVEAATGTQEPPLLVSQENSFKALFDSAPDAIFVENREGFVLDANPAACALQGISRQELIGRSVFELVPEEMRAETRKRFKGWFDGTLGKLESETRTPDGKCLPVEITGRIMEYDGQEAVLLQVRDISERFALEQQLRMSQKMDAVGRLAGGVAHDFNNLLTTILGFGHIVLDSDGMNSAQRTDLLQVINAANRAADLTRQLMVFGKRQLQALHPVNINATLRDIDPLLRRTIGSQIEVVTLLAEDLATIQSDESHIEQIIMNISVNSMDAMPEGGQLTLQTYNKHLDKAPKSAPPGQPPGDYAVLEISDTGSGISPEHLEHVFEPFYSTKEPGGGVGLGLSTVYGIVQHANGFMEVQSEKDVGTNVRIFLPASNDPLVVREILEQVELPQGNETLLLVEDESLVLNLTERYLNELGYKVLTALNGSEALRVMEEFDGPIHMVITDIIMPQMGGLELISRIREKNKGTKVLYISGYGDNVFSLSDMAHEAHLLLAKPYSKSGLAKKTREILEEN